MVAVVEPEVGGHAGEQHEVGLTQALAPAVPGQQRVVGAEQAARHAGEVDRGADPLQRGHEPLGAATACHALAAEEDHRPLGARQPPGGFGDARGVRCGWGDLDGGRGWTTGGAAEQIPDPQSQVRPHGALLRGPSRPGRPVPLADQRLVVEQVDRELDEHRPGHVRLADPERLLEDGHDVADPAHRARPLDVRAHQRHLVDVLQGAAPLQRRGRGAAEHDHR